MGDETTNTLFRVAMIGFIAYIRDYLLACFLDSFETNKIRCKIHVTYQFVVAQPNVPAMTAPLFHGKPREETDTSRPHPTAIPPTPQLLYSPRTTEGRLSVGSSSLPKKETARVSKINPSAFKGKNFVTNSLYWRWPRRPRCDKLSPQTRTNNFFFGVCVFTQICKVL